MTRLVGTSATIKRQGDAADPANALALSLSAGIAEHPDFLEVWEPAVVMPMTVRRRDYFIELASALRAADGDLRCFRLTACEQVLRARILGRDPLEGSHEWCLGHLPSGLEMMRDRLFGQEVATCDRSPEEVAELIVAALTKSSPKDGGDLTQTMRSGSTCPLTEEVERSPARLRPRSVLRNGGGGCRR